MRRMPTPTRILLAAAIAALPLATACGSSGTASSSSPPVTPAPDSSAPASSQPASSSGAGALVAEAQSAAAGDIPDNQVFLTYHNAAAGYSMVYPEGWARRGSGKRVLFQDKSNLARIVIEPGAATATQARAALAALAATTPSLKLVSVTAHPSCTNQGATVPLPLASAKVVYTTLSAPSPVTGKRLQLSVDRYYLGHGAQRAVVDLGTPQGVDNVDAYCQMIKSFRWH
jgi:hypothetical protein